MFLFYKNAIVLKLFQSFSSIHAFNSMHLTTKKNNETCISKRQSENTNLAFGKFYCFRNDQVSSFA